MRIIEFGKENSEIMLLVHGMQVPWQMWTMHIKHFSKQYHIIFPILSGHDTEEISTFLSIHKEAEEIECFLLQRKYKQISVVCGISMGGTISALLWERGNIQINKLFLDGAPLVPYNTVVSKVITKQYSQLTHKIQNRDNKTLEKGKKNFIPLAYFDYFLDMIDVMTEQTIKNCVQSISAFQLSRNCNTTHTDIAYLHGTGSTEYYSKKSAKFLKKYYPKVHICSLRGLGHCENFLFSPDKHILMIIDELIISR